MKATRILIMAVCILLCAAVLTSCGDNGEGATASATPAPTGPAGTLSLRARTITPVCFRPGG